MRGSMDFLWDCRLAMDQSTRFLNANVLMVIVFLNRFTIVVLILMRSVTSTRRQRYWNSSALVYSVLIRI